MNANKSVINHGLCISRFIFVFILLVTTFLSSGLAHSVTQATSHPTASTQTVTISTGEWSPLISKSLKNNGPISTVVTEAFAISGIKVKYRFYPWKRAMQELRSGRVVASSAWRKTTRRQKEFLFSEGVYANNNVFFHLKSTPFDWKTLDDLKPYDIGASLGYAYSEAFEKYEQQGKLDVFRVNKESSLVDMLLSNRIDIFPANREVGLALIRTLSPEAINQFTFHPTPISDNPLHIIFNKDKTSQWLLKAFNEGLRELKKSGRYADIYRQQ